MCVYPISGWTWLSVKPNVLCQHDVNPWKTWLSLPWFSFSLLKAPKHILPCLARQSAELAKEKCTEIQGHGASTSCGWPDVQGALGSFAVSFHIPLSLVSWGQMPGRHAFVPFCTPEFLWVAQETRLWCYPSSPNTPTSHSGRVSAGCLLYLSSQIPSPARPPPNAFSGRLWKEGCACLGNICPLEYHDHLFSPHGLSRSPNHSILPLSPHCSELQRCNSDRASWGWFLELACRLQVWWVHALWRSMCWKVENLAVKNYPSFLAMSGKPSAPGGRRLMTHKGRQKWEMDPAGAG